MMYLLLFISYLKNAQYAFTFLSEGLQIWFFKMIPALFPAVLWNHFVIQTGAAKKISKYVYPFFHKMFGVSYQGAFVILAGFICGFPLGAKVVSDLYQRKELTQREANYLLCFCNLIGPAYVFSFFLQKVSVQKPWLLLLLLYGIPFLYGHILSKLSGLDCYFKEIKQAIHAAECKSQPPIQVSISGKTAPDHTGKPDFIQTLDEGIQQTIDALVILGGYMISFQLLRLFLLPLPDVLRATLAPFIEINTGIQQALSISSVTNAEMGYITQNMVGAAFLSSDYYPVTAVAFTGLCCHAQACHYIRKAGLSCRKYLIHKIILTGITFFSCLSCFCLHITL